MVNFYKKMVIRGNKKWTEVPALWNEKVKEALEADGYTLNANGTGKRLFEECEKLPLVSKAEEIKREKEGEKE